MTAPPDPLPSPLFDRITTLVAPADDSLAAVVAALAISYRTGVPLIPGFTPFGPGDVSLYAFDYTFIGWKGLVSAIAAAAGIPAPTLYIECPEEPLVTAKARRRDPDAARYWDRVWGKEMEANIAIASIEGRDPIPHLTIVFGLEAAAGGVDRLRQLYEDRRRSLILMAGVEADVSWAADFGRVVMLPELRGIRWNDFLADLTGGDRPAIDPEERDTPVDDGAHVQGRSEADVVTQPLDGLAILFGYASVFGEWREVNDPFRGRFLERIDPAAFANVAAEMSAMKVSFRHGGSSYGFLSLGTLARLEADAHGLWYEVQMIDAEHTRELIPGLVAGKYRSSITFEVIADHLVRDPGPSEHNPLGLPELTILEVYCSELGPCENPAYAGTSAGIHIATDPYSH